MSIVIKDFPQTESDTGADIPEISSDILAILNHKITYTMFVKNMWQQASKYEVHICCASTRCKRNCTHEFFQPCSISSGLFWILSVFIHICILYFILKICWVFFYIHFQYFLFFFKLNFLNLGYFLHHVYHITSLELFITNLCHNR